tara:strand:- start:236 stop:580 length:345 start_codon:yes stop_codon:yes gene_type:complete
MGKLVPNMSNIFGVEKDFYYKRIITRDYIFIKKMNGNEVLDYLNNLKKNNKNKFDRKRVNIINNNNINYIKSYCNICCNTGNSLGCKSCSQLLCSNCIKKIKNKCPYCRSSFTT